MWQRPAQPALHDRSSGPSLLLSSEATHTPPHTQAREPTLGYYCLRGILLSPHFHSQWPYYPQTACITMFLYCSPLVSTNTEDSTITLRKRQDWGLPKLSIGCALYRKQEKIRAEAMVEYVCAASASLSCLLLAWYTYRSTSYCSTTDDEEVL